VNIVYGLMMREMNDFVARRAQLTSTTSTFTTQTSITTSSTTSTQSSFFYPNQSSNPTELPPISQPFTVAPNFNGTFQEAQEIFINNSYNLCMIVILFGVTRFLALYLALLFFSRAAANQAKRVKALFFRSLLRQEVAWFERNRTGDFAIRITSDLSKFEDGIGEKIALCLNALFAWMSSLISSFYYGWELTLVCLVLVPLTIFITTLIAQFQANYSFKEGSALSGAFNVCHEVISSIRTVMSYSGQEKELKRFKRGLDGAYKYGLNRNMFAGLNLGFTWMSGYLGFAICLLYSTKFFKPEHFGHYDEAHIITILWSAAGCVFLLNRMMPFIEIIQMARASASNLFAVIERQSQIDATSDEGLRPQFFEANVVFDNVSFTYPTQSNAYNHLDPSSSAESCCSETTISNMSMQVASGQTIALVGPSGSGKSTALALLQRFYNIDEGSITLGGHNLSELNLGWLRGQFGVVTQEPVLFDMSIADNIRLGAKPGQTVSDYDIEQAARSANAHSFIVHLPNGYETRAGARGVQLSGGQKQRIAIARALVRQPKILLLDEATSALDLESESIVQKALDQARIGRTTFIVAHRLSTVRNADKIIVFDRGTIVDSGTHEELMQKRGLYYQINAQQKQGIDLLPTGGEDHHTRESRSLSIYSNTGKYAPTTAGGFDAAGHGGNGEGVDNAPVGGSCCESPTDDDYYNRNGDEDEDESEDTSGGLPLDVDLKGSRIIIGNDETQASLLDGDSIGVINSKGKRVTNLSIWSVLKFIKPDMTYSLIGVFASLLMGLCIPISAMIIGNIATIFATDDPAEIRRGLYSHGLLYTGLAMFAFCVSFVQVLSFGVAGEKIGINLRLQGFRAIMDHELSWFDQKRNNPGSICARLASDVGNVQSITGNRTAVIFQSISILVSTFIFAVYFNLKFSSICAVFVATLLISTVMQAKFAGKLAMANRQLNSEIGKIVLESSANIKTLVSLHQEEHFIQRCEQLLARDKRSTSLDNHLRLSLESLKYALTAISKGSSFYFAAGMLLRDEISIDVIFKLIEIILYGLTEASKSLIFISDLEKARRGTQNLYKLIHNHRHPLEDQKNLFGSGEGGPDSCIHSKSLKQKKSTKRYLPRILVTRYRQSGYKQMENNQTQNYPSDAGGGGCTETTEYKSLPSGDSSGVGGKSDSKSGLLIANQFFDPLSLDKGSQAAKCEGCIKFSSVRFHYPSRPDACVLKSLSIDIPAGESVALVGRSGCGKSTIVQLLEKFYQNSYGDILLDGKNIRHLPTEWVRKQIALVSQEPSLLSYTIGDNIRYGDNSRQVPLEEVVDAAQVANIHEFIMSLPDGYDTLLSESNSLQLSGGQKQRIAIARALVRKAPILIFDEATSALDTKSEHIVQEALDRARSGKTCIIIAHRLSTIKSADRIVVLRDGMVVEQGTHHELLSKRGEYYCLYKTQSKM